MQSSSQISSETLPCISGGDRGLLSRTQPGAFQDAQFSSGQRTPPRVVKPFITSPSYPAISATSPSIYGDANDVYKSVRERIMEYLARGNLLTKEALKNMGIGSLRGIDLSGLDLRGADLSDTDLRGADLSNTDLSYAALFNANLSNANLRYANLSHANLSHAKLCRAKLCHAKLCHAIVWWADLSNTDLSNTNLGGANLSNTDLRGADLSNTDLSNTNLGGVNLSNANLRGAKLKNIQGVFKIFGVLIDQNTKISWSRSWLDKIASMVEYRDENFNHINNPSGSIFTIINALLNIDAKVECLDEVAEVILRKHDLYLKHNCGNNIITELTEPLLDSLFKEFAYTDTTMGTANENIRNLVDELITNIFKSDRFFNFKYNDSASHKALLHYIENRIQGEDQTWIQDHNTQIQCCLYTLSKSEDQEIQEKALALKVSVYQMDFLKEICAQYQSDICLEKDELLRNSLIFISEDQNQVVVMRGLYFDFYYLGENINPPGIEEVFLYKKTKPEKSCLCSREYFFT